MNYFNKLKTKWNITSNWSLFWILVVFSVSGSSIVYFFKFVSYIFGFDENTPAHYIVITRILLIFPTYQILLLIYGFIFGQFAFFWEKEKKMVQWLGKVLGIIKK